MEDWEDEQIPPLLLKQQPKSQWDDEDLNESDVKESWEDEDEPAPAPPVQPPQKVASKPASKAPVNRGKTAEAEQEEALDPLAEKLHQQR